MARFDARAVFVAVGAVAGVLFACDGLSVDGTEDGADGKAGAANCAADDCATDDGTSGGSGGGAFVTPCAPIEDTSNQDGLGGASDGGNGWEWCEEGYSHRVRATACPSLLPRSGDIYVNESLDNECERDEDCPGLHAFCADPDVERAPGNVCMNGCTTDDECGSGAICDCGALIGKCIPATCRSDDECAEGTLCVTTASLRPGNAYVFDPIVACHVPEDECLASTDCEGSDQCYWEDGTRVCRDHSYF